MKISFLLETQEAVNCGQKDLGFYIGNLIADFIILSKYPHEVIPTTFWLPDTGYSDELYKAFYAKGEEIRQQLNQILELRHQDAILRWHKNFFPKLWCQYQLHLLEAKKLSWEELSNYCGLICDNKANVRNMLLVSDLFSVYDSNRHRDFITGSSLLEIRRNSLSPQEACQRLAEKIDLNGNAAQEEARRWRCHHLMSTNAGETLYFSIGNCEALAVSYVKYHGLKRWLIKKDIRQRRDQRISISQALNWLRYLYVERRSLSEEKFEADLEKYF